MNLPLITAMVSVLGIWAKFCNIAFQFDSLPSFLPSFLPPASPSFLPSLLPLPFLPQSFLPSFLPLLVSFYVLFDAFVLFWCMFVYFLMHFYVCFDASPIYSNQ